MSKPEWSSELKNPCYNTKTKTDCPRRAVGCAADCDDWKEYEKRRNVEYIKTYNNKEACYISDAIKKKYINHLKYERRKRREEDIYDE